LAASWALTGKRTILVCADLRRPRIHEFFGGSEMDKGLAEILAGRTSSAQETANLLRETPIEGLSFLPAGYPQGDPADGLASTTMTRVIEQLRELADIVIVDSPPVLAVADAAIAAVHADGAIVVVRANKTLTRDIAETMKRLRAGSVNVVGVALNRVRHVTRSAYGDYYRTAVRKPVVVDDEYEEFVEQPAAPVVQPAPREPAGGKRVSQRRPSPSPDPRRAAAAARARARRRLM
jgi:capsular exopolysaccharide synthesis family protein